jgi:hypothetical protein
LGVSKVKSGANTRDGSALVMVRITTPLGGSEKDPLRQTFQYLDILSFRINWSA